MSVGRKAGAFASAEERSIESKSVVHQDKKGETRRRRMRTSMSKLFSMEKKKSNFGQRRRLRDPENFAAAPFPFKRRLEEKRKVPPPFFMAFEK